MLALRPNCECCDKDLPNGAADALICTFECTFCVKLRGDPFQRTLPQLHRRPGQAPDAAGGDAGEVSSLDRARAQAA